MATVDQVDAVVVVDPYSSGRFLLYELKARGIPIICVRSCLSLGSFFLRVYDTHRDYFAVTIDFQEEAGSDLQQLVDRLVSLPYRVLAVFGGCEPGVELAERLAEALALPTANGTELLLARKDKAEMQNCLRLNGVPAAEQHKSGILEELLSWARARGQWPLVAKPLSSSGSDGIFFCQNEEDLESAHKVIVGALNPNGVQNTDIALQEFLTGDEYIVDSVSRDGRHQCVAIWVYSKRRGLPWNATAILSEGNTLLPAEGAIQDVLVDYVFKVLDAVGLRFGPCHTEVMLTPRGPILVEVNCRLHGLQGPRLIELATGTSKATAAADVLLGGDSPVEGFLTEPIQDTILAMNLASVVEILPALQKGGYLRQSIDLNSSAGTLLMVHSSKEQLEADIAQIRAAEESGLLYPVSRSRLPSSPMASPRGFGTDAAQCSSPRMQSMENSQQIWAAEMDVLDALPEAADFQLSGLS
eukprot:CAMPEP_0115153448 /NCGR_PEP_ID=MMETSP0227-20121206/66733_1 /TAXON_ID=89957 /ORGANISM="Polarella glacialis, Strain CCMP 1383" /LENGTH=470 /DNA_ID=CAMNT_0002564191 /DNA_START=36 /DNA_END=1448 /DNA_ORIENTATION=+